MTRGKENTDPNNPMHDAWLRSWCVPVILLMLRQWSSYGYELMEKLTAFGLQAMNPGTFYRMLRQMEKDGMVISSWDTSVTGPARRIYTITETGEAHLKLRAESLDQYQKMMNAFFDLYTIPTNQQEKEDD
jgi:PadR family transcriptional regulator PadR